MSKTVADTRVEMTQVVLPQFANNHGNVFGGQVVAWIDICAAVAAQRLCRKPVVTASIDAVHFMAPVRAGEVCILKGQVNASFRTSMECGVSVWSENPLTGELKKCVSAYATFVALGEDDRPTPVPHIVLEDKEDERRSKNAKERRKARLALKKIMATHR